MVQREADDARVGRARLLGADNDLAAAVALRRAHLGPSVERGVFDRPAAVGLDAERQRTTLARELQRFGRRRKFRCDDVVIIVLTARKHRGDGKCEKRHEQQPEKVCFKHNVEFKLIKII